MKTTNQFFYYPFLVKFWKSFLICNRTHNFLLGERLSKNCQSAFRPFDSCMHQLVSTTHSIFEAFECNPPLEIRSVSSDISKPFARCGIKDYFIKVFDKVWHQELLYKLRSMAISEELYSLLKNYLSGGFQRFILNWQTSSWRPVLADVPQGLNLDPLIFSYFVNDLHNELKSNAKLLLMTCLFLPSLRIKLTVPAISTMIFC